MPKLINTEDYLKRCIEVHGDKYDLSLVEYKSSKDNVKVICKEHGLFEMRAGVFLRANCPKCSTANSSSKRCLTKDEFITRSVKMHNDRYNYSAVDYKNNSTKVTITCKEHGDFQQVPSSHLQGMGCRKCAGIVVRSKLLKDQSFFDKKIVESGLQDKYDFSKANYVDTTTKVTVTCPVHGDFATLPGNLYKGHGCKKCFSERQSKESRDTTYIFIEKAIKRHGALCDYSLVDYVDSHTKVRIICKEHGEFSCSPNSHLTGSGTSCPTCNRLGISKRFSKDTQHFIDRSRFTHGDRYDYSKSVYINCDTKVEIVCEVHGSFWQTPYNHYEGSGCSACQSFGFRTNLVSYLYVMSSDDITKIGICNRHPQERKSNIEKSSGRSFKIEMFWEFDEGLLVKNLEQHLLKSLRSTNTSVTDVFDGSTECFIGISPQSLIKQVKTLLESTYAY